MAELWQLDATEQISLVASREVSPRELIEAHLARIEQVNPTLNAVALALNESALATADRTNRAGQGGLLRGLPFTVKSDIDCLGSETTRGVAALRNALPYSDAPVVARMRAAGAIPIARTNLSELGLRLCTDNPLHGRTLNPRDRSLTVGGSSGGDAVAVATGMTPVGIGGDLGGSLRVPAACCGCLALKPTTGRVARASSLEPREAGLATQLMLAIGPLTRSVADLRLVLAVIAGRDVRDPASVDVALNGPVPDELSAALITSLPGQPIADSARDAVRRAGRSLEAAGWNVEEVQPPELARVHDVFVNLIALEFGVLAHQLQPIISDSLFEHLLRLGRSNLGRELSPFKLHAERFRLIREWSHFLGNYAVLIGPNLARPIWQIDADLSPDTGIALLDDATRFITPGNALGLPSLALPMGTVDRDPTSVLIYADLWREDLCLLAAEAIERRQAKSLPIDACY